MIQQKDLNKLKRQAERIGNWAKYLVSETEYWAPEDLEKLTPEILRREQESASGWLNRNMDEYPVSGAEEVLQQDFTDQVKDSPNALPYEEATELEMLRINEEMKSEEIPRRLEQIRKDIEAKGGRELTTEEILRQYGL
jgi:hypothetical protein